MLLPSILPRNEESNVCTERSTSALPNDVNTPQGWGCATGSGQDRRGYRGCAIRAGLGVSDLHSLLRDENPPRRRQSATQRGAAGGLPRQQGCVQGWGKRAGRGEDGDWKAGGGADTCPPPLRPHQQLLLRRGRTPAAGQPDTRPGGGLGPAAASGFIPLISQGAKPRGGQAGGQAAPLRAAARSGSPRRRAGRAERGAGGRERPGLRGAGGSAPQPLGRGAWSGDAGRARQARPAGPSSGSGARRQAEAADPTHSPLSISLPFLAVAAFPMAGPGRRGVGRMPGGCSGRGQGSASGAARPAGAAAAASSPRPALGLCVSGRRGGGGERSAPLPHPDTRRKWRPGRRLLPATPPAGGARGAGRRPRPSRCRRRRPGAPPGPGEGAAGARGDARPRQRWLAEGRCGGAALGPRICRCGGGAAASADPRSAAGLAGRRCGSAPASALRRAGRPAGRSGWGGGEARCAQGDPGRLSAPRPGGCTRPALGARPPPPEHPRRPGDTHPAAAPAKAPLRGPRPPAVRSRRGLHPGSVREETRTCRLFTVFPWLNRL